MGYTMKGFSGFGNSPMKKKIWPPTKGEFNIDYDEIDKEGKPTYNDPTDPKSPNYNPKHGGSDFVKPKGAFNPKAIKKKSQSKNMEIAQKAIKNASREIGEEEAQLLMQDKLKPKSKIGMKQWYKEEEEETKRINP